jgi:hypothetical protein
MGLWSRISIDSSFPENFSVPAYTQIRERENAKKWEKGKYFWDLREGGSR